MAAHKAPLPLRMEVGLCAASGRCALPLDAPTGELATFLQLNFSVLRGLALFRILEHDDQIEGMLQMWIAMTSDFLAKRAQARKPILQNQSTKGET